MEKDLIILRGLPNSGKSAFATMFNTKAICCADEYLVHDDTYIWDYRYLDSAHKWCERKCRRFMKAQAERIVIANTSVTVRQFQVYLDLAKQFNYKVFSVIIETRHDNKNTHNVPIKTIEKMRKRFEIQL
jgi:predicted kinase